jgi:Ferrochelatase
MNSWNIHSQQLKTFSLAEMTDGLHILFSAHGVPESYIAAGDPYLRHTEECVRLISKDVSDMLRSDVTRPAGMSKALGLQLAGSILAAAGTATTTTGSATAGSLLGTTGTTVGAGAGTVTGISASTVPAVQFHLSFQSRVGPVQWLK